MGRPGGWSTAENQRDAIGAAPHLIRWLPMNSAFPTNRHAGAIRGSSSNRLLHRFACRLLICLSFIDLYVNANDK
jgi:hypothetical protein